MTAALDPFVEALRRLCEREGGYVHVAGKAHINADNLRQLLGGARLPSGKRRSVGRMVRDAITRAYPDWLDPAIEGHALKKGTAATLIAERLAVYSPQLSWESLMSGITLPPIFHTVMPDESMAPRIRRDDLIEFDSRLLPRSGDGVLVRDGTGALYFRVYRQGPHGIWEAHPVNPDYLPLHSQRDTLEVVGVMIGAPRNRWG